jgi:undecaprenyl diphosphate synthase
VATNTTDPSSTITGHQTTGHETKTRVTQAIIQKNLTHVAIIMDGNRRWAKQRFLPGILGHRQGVTALERIITCACNLKLPLLTVYAFSTENWSRPVEEVDGLMQLFVVALRQQLQALMTQRVKVRFIGDVSAMPAPVRAILQEVTEKTAANEGLCLQIATNYGSRAELTHAVTRIAMAVKAGELDPHTITEATLAQHLYTAHMPDPDVLIRTGGESRLSNYLLWQCAYAELVISPILWPDFTADAFLAILDEVNQRHRRFGH